MTNSDYEKLISTASAKLGSSPEQLKNALSKGDIAGLSSNLSKADKEKLRAILGNKQLMAKLKNASSPEELMKILGAK